MSRKFKLHIAETEDFSLSVLEKMRELFELSTGPVSDLKQLLEQVDIFWFRLAFRIDKTVLTFKTKCKIIASPVTGIDHIDETLCKDLGIEIICLRGEREFLKEVRATAEHSILLAMLVMRKASEAVQSVNSKLWNRDAFRGHEIYKKTVGILGLGRLGKIVAEYYEALGCKIYYYDIAEVEDGNGYTRLESAEQVVKVSDIVSIHIPYNESTYHIYSSAFFSEFDQNKWLINTSRGGVIDEKYLLEALKSNRIAGAALDVLDGEPNIENNPLIGYAAENDNLIITPHIGGNTYESFEKTETFIAERIIKQASNW